MTSVIKIDAQYTLADSLDNLSLQDRESPSSSSSALTSSPSSPKEKQSETQIVEMGMETHLGVCAICLNKIALQETAIMKDCEHAYCVTCILQWATYSQKPTCPQCKHPFEFLNVHRSIDGRLHDFMFEESVCLLLRASWFKPLVVEDHEETYDELEDFYQYYCEDEDMDEAYFSSSSSIRIGNRRWGDNGYIRAGRLEARPVPRSNSHNSSASTSREAKKTEVEVNRTGRRAKRTLKREAANKAAAAAARRDG